MESILKRCTKCQVDKLATTEFFARKRDTKDGFAHRCKACASEANREWQKANPGYATAQGKKWRDSNPQAYQAFLAQDKERGTARAKAFNRANPERHSLANRRCRAKKSGAKGDHTVEDIALQFLAQNGLCLYCKQEISNSYDIDHVVPIARGGSNGPENIVVACASCNRSKADKLPFEWLEGGRP